MQSLLSKRHLAAAQATPVQPQRRSAALQHGRAFVRLPHQLPKSTPSGVCRAGPGADQSPGAPPDPWVAATSYDRTAAVGDTELQASAADQQEAAYNVPAYAPQYAQQGAPRPEYYMAAPPTYPVPTYAPPPPAAAGSSIPWWVWMGAGILVANVARLVQDVVKKGPQQMMMEMAMKQMMKGAPGGAPGGSPFGGMPGGMPGSPPFPYGNQNPFAPGFNPSAMGGSPATSTVDTTATDVPGKQQAAAASAPTSGSDASRGEKFNARIGSDGRPSSPPSSGTESGAKANGVDVIEPEVKEPSSKASSSSSSSSSSGATSSSSFFTDVGAGSSSGNGDSNGGASSSTGTGGADPSQMTAMMEQMLRDPSMQKMLYPYLPEPMRNPESIDWMLNNPEVRKQMEQVFAQQGMGMNPQMMEMMKQMDFSQEKVQAQFSELGLKPEDVINKVLATPDLAAGFSNPKVQQAIFDISQNPMNITKYQEDPEVMKVLEKVTELFGPSMGGAGGMAGMGGMPGMGGMGQK